MMEYGCTSICLFTDDFCKNSVCDEHHNKMPYWIVPMKYCHSNDSSNSLPQQSTASPRYSLLIHVSANKKECCMHLTPTGILTESSKLLCNVPSIQQHNFMAFWDRMPFNLVNRHQSLIFLRNFDTYLQIYTASQMMRP